MEAAAVLERLTALGVEVTPRPNGNLYLAPASRIPPDLLVLVRQHKRALRALLRGEGVEPQGQYRQVYSGDGPGAGELAEMENRVKREGYVLCWSEVVQDFVAFHRDDVEPGIIPVDFVPYSLIELTHLFREDGVPLSVNALRLAHEAKKAGARVTGNYPDRNQEAE